MTELINRHGETCKQVIIIKRIKKRTNQKASTITFLKKKKQFWSRNWALEEVKSFQLANMLPSFTFIEIAVKQNVVLNILRHVELTNDFVWRIEGFRWWKFNRYKSIFILQLIRAVELMLFIMKIAILFFLRLTTINFSLIKFSQFIVVRCGNVPSVSFIWLVVQ